MAAKMTDKTGEREATITRRTDMKGGLRLEGVHTLLLHHGRGHHHDGVHDGRHHLMQYGRTRLATDSGPDTDLVRLIIEMGMVMATMPPATGGR